MSITKTQVTKAGGNKQTAEVRFPRKPLTEEQFKEEVRKEAQTLYEKKGCIPGNELGDWLEAEKLVKERITYEQKNNDC